VLITGDVVDDLVLDTADLDARAAGGHGHPLPDPRVHRRAPGAGSAAARAARRIDANAHTNRIPAGWVSHLRRVVDGQVMGLRLVVAVVGLVVVTASCTGGPTTRPSVSSDGGDRVCDRDGCVSARGFARSVADQLGDSVVGYVALVGRDPAVASGWARTPADPPEVRMGADVPVSTGSVAKIFTTIAVLQLLSRLRLPVDTPMARFLPPDWAKGPGVDAVTFRDLLTHRAGFRMDSDAVFTDDQAARKQVATGVLAADRAQADYNNLDFAIFRDLLPAMLGVADPGPATRSKAADALFVDYVRRHVFEPAGVDDARCAPVAGAALAYPPVQGTDRAVHGQEARAAPTACAAGGWVLTPTGLLRILTALIDTDTLLSKEQRQLMNDDCLGWDCSTDGRTPGLVGKLGVDGVRPAALLTDFDIVKDRLPVVVVITSDPGLEKRFLIQNALRASTTH
jgi:CubicO group peptidase (beta-lactamase class C family)